MNGCLIRSEASTVGEFLGVSALGAVSFTLNNQVFFIPNFLFENRIKKAEYFFKEFVKSIGEVYSKEARFF